MSTVSTKACLSGDRCQPRSLAEAVYCLIHHSVKHEQRIEPADIARAIGTRVGYLLDAANPDRDNTHFQTTWLIPATLYTGNDIVVKFLASEAHGVFFKLPEVMPGHEDLFDGLAEAMTELGRDADAIRAALKNDGRIDGDEARTILAEVDGTIAALGVLRRRVQDKARQEEAAPIKITRVG